MERGKLDLLDVASAAGLAAFVILWAFVWGAPAPHSDVPPFPAIFGVHPTLGVLSVLGKCALGVFASLVYLILRGVWIHYRDIDDEAPDRFFFTRFSPLCGAAVFAFSPSAWRAAQFLSPGFALVTLAVLAVFLWQRGCGYRNLFFIALAYGLLSLVAALNPLGLAPLAYIASRDVARRWKSQQEHGQRDDDADVESKFLIEVFVTVLATLTGLLAAVGWSTDYFHDGQVRPNALAIALAWGRGYVRACGAVLRDASTPALLIGVVTAVSAVAIGRRLRAKVSSTFALSVTFGSVLALALGIFALRATWPDGRDVRRPGDAAGALPTVTLDLTFREAAGVMFRRADYEQAIRYANEVLAHEPNDAEMLQVRAQASRKLGNLKAVEMRSSPTVNALNPKKTVEP